MHSKIRSIVFACLQDNTLDILVVYGYGMADGGCLSRVDLNIGPMDCRMPNNHVWVTFEDGKALAVEKMTPQEAEENDPGINTENNLQV